MEQQQKIKKVNPWIEHCKKYALDNNIPYRDAIKLAKATYKVAERPQSVEQSVDKPVKKVRKPAVKEEQPTEIQPVIEFVEEPVKKVKKQKKIVNK